MVLEMKICEWFCDGYIHECGSDFSEREQLFKEKQGTKNAILSKDQNLAGSQRKKNLQRMYLI